ncbi:MAG: hypothetical protein HWE27_00220 [Gammaproteobacteria bacterium]|nr:hypothetical protein [Gammaproteobacteria bacterium]
MRNLLLFLALIILGCASRPETKGLSLTEDELASILEVFESECSCGKSRATLILSCADEKSPASEETCFEVFMDGNHPVVGQTDEKPLYCLVRKINGSYTGVRTVREKGTQITVISGCIR